MIREAEQGDSGRGLQFLVDESGTAGIGPGEVHGEHEGGAEPCP